MNGAFTPLGIWYARHSAKRAAADWGVLLDRDGVLVAERNYLHDPAEVALTPSVLALVLSANKRGVPVAVVTNQSGIDRGFFGWEDFFAVETEIDRQLSARGAVIDFKVACPFHPDFTPGYGPAHEVWRKPGPGMVRFACQTLGIDPAKSWMVGDKSSDIGAAKAAGLCGAYFLRGAFAGEEPAAIALADAQFSVCGIDADAPIPLFD